MRDPLVVVRSDAAKELTLAVSDLGWHPEPSLEKSLAPHNHQHERWHGAYKSVLRACMLQSGFPEVAWDFAVPYVSMSLNVCVQERHVSFENTDKVVTHGS